MSKIGGVVVSHGQLATELLSAAETIVGPVDHILAVSIGWHDDVDIARDEIERAIKQTDQGTGVIVMTDMFGGTPTNISAMFHITKAALPHMKPGAAIINTASINADSPSPNLLPYATTKGAIQNFTAGLAQLLAERGIRANAVAPGPVWTPLIPSTMPPEKVKNFGKQVPMGRPAQPAELAPPYVMLASDEASYISGATIAVTGGKPVI